MHINSKLYRIIKGRFRLCVSGLFLLFNEPNSDLIEQSYEVYDEVYDEAYGDDSYIKKEIEAVLLEQSIWDPTMDKELDRQTKALEDLKVEAFESFFQPNQLKNVKMRIWMANKQIEILLGRKHKMDHLTCDGVAENARLIWLLSECIKPASCDGAKLLEAYQEQSISHSEIRKIARSDLWRGIWNASKKGTQLFDRIAVDLTRDQVALISYSSMYDNVYEHPESPNDKVTEDDDCLDGWFIIQKRKNEKQKKQSEVDAVTKNPKIANAKEVYVMAKSTEDADGVYGLNNSLSRGKIQARSQELKNSGSGKLREQELSDVRMDIEMEKMALIRQHKR